MTQRRSTRWIIMFFYACAALQSVRYYSQSTRFYLNVPAYLSGQERLPFQERVLPIFFIKALAPFLHSHWAVTYLSHPDKTFTPDRQAFYILSLISFFVAVLFTQKLYTAITRTHTLGFLVFPFFLFATMWTYGLHNEANFSYPYDLSSLAFFTAGLYYIFRRRFLPLALIMLVGTLNRETTLFLIGLYLIDAASTPDSPDNPDFTHDAEFAGAKDTSFAPREIFSLRDRFSLRRVSWWRVALLCVIWGSVKLALVHHYAHNDPSENFVRIAENLGRLKIRLIPALLNICGYTLPIVFLFRRDLRPNRFANYLYILPAWFAVMFYTAVIVETRIYGELCSFSAIALVLIIEHNIAPDSLSAEPELILSHHLSRQSSLSAEHVGM